MKKIYVIVFSIVMFGSLFAQQVGNSDYKRVGELEIINTNAGEKSDKKVATELVQTVLVEDFETAGEWTAFMPRDYGIATSMRREGSPRDLESDRNRYVLGVKVEFMKRDWSWATVVPAKPVKIKGITKTVTVWVVGRNYKHTISLILKDYLDRLRFVKSERLIWTGWKQVNINIPDTIEQENYKITEDRGITFIGFRLDFEPEDILGRPFYTYFDYMTADVDLFSETKQNPDDMLDHW
ncbi:MAG: flagellar filament outer layer protein FlaA [Brevinematales bacterium]|nr:flagellar filament outer layer protein FlaA [Brevinematales bacterium]